MNVYVCMYVYILFIYLFIYVVYSQHAPLPLVILHALPPHLRTSSLVTYEIYIPNVWFSCSYVMYTIALFIFTVLYALEHVM